MLLHPADAVVAGAQVADDGRPFPAHLRRGGNGDPEILADLQPHGEVGVLLTGKALSGAKGDIFPAKADVGDPLRGGLEDAGLVKLLIIAQVDLGHHTQDIPLVQHDGAVEQLAQMPHGHPHRQEELQLRGLLPQGGEGFLGAVQQGFLEKQIGAGIAGERELRRHQQLCAPGRRLPGEGCDLFPIVPAVRQVQRRGRRRDLDPTIFHKRGLLCHTNSRCPFPRTGINRNIITFFRQKARKS